mmetsp:Transcript_136095/g.322598  ORF Transcript_136095/g.322598 Transcript_136095/m.322598 type:complete len:244 (+) Transcript_136095:402-1133(+)
MPGPHRAHRQGGASLWAQAGGDRRRAFPGGFAGPVHSERGRARQRLRNKPPAGGPAALRHHHGGGRALQRAGLRLRGGAGAAAPPRGSKGGGLRAVRGDHGADRGGAGEVGGGRLLREHLRLRQGPIRGFRLLQRGRGQREGDRSQPRRAWQPFVLLPELRRHELLRELRLAQRAVPDVSDADAGHAHAGHDHEHGLGHDADANDGGRCGPTHGHGPGPGPRPSLWEHHASLHANDAPDGGSR